MTTGNGCSDGAKGAFHIAGILADPVKRTNVVVLFDQFYYIVKCRPSFHWFIKSYT